MIVVTTAFALLLVIAVVNQRMTSAALRRGDGGTITGEHASRFDGAQQPDHQRAGDDPRGGVDLGSRHGGFATAQVRGAGPQHRLGRGLARVRLLTQVGMLGWGAYLAHPGRDYGRHGDRGVDHRRPRARADRGRDRGLEPFLLIARRLRPDPPGLLKSSPLQFERLRCRDPKAGWMSSGFSSCRRGPSRSSSTASASPHPGRIAGASSAIPARARPRSARCWSARSCPPRATCGST